MSARERIFATLYAASGAAALVYEVAWTRLLTQQMGHTVATVSTVLAAFMGGLAAGAWLGGGRLSPSPARRLRAYAALEILVALSAIVLPIVLRGLTPALAWAYADADAPVRFALVRVALTLGVLFVPTAAMGATYPIATAWLADATVRSRSAAGRASSDAGLLYATNTAGAAAGALCAGFWLIPALGIRGTAAVGVVLSATAAFGALWLAGREGADTTAPETGAAAAQAHRNRKRLPKPALPAVAGRPVLACSAAALSGFAGLVYEVGLTRLLAVIIGPTTYAFATMAASFVIGIALGSAVGTRISRRTGQPALWLAAMLVMAAASASFASWFAASRLPLIVAAEVVESGGAFRPVVLRQALEVVLLLLPLTLALGAAFPFALATAFSDDATVGRDTARVYVGNTAGAIAGALAAGFVLVPLLGLEGTFLLTSDAAAVGGAILAAFLVVSRARLGGRRLVPLCAAVIAAATLVVAVHATPWDRDLLSSGAYKYAPYITAAGPTSAEFKASLRAGRLEYYAEGPAATVSVRLLGGRLALAIDGKVDASNGGDMLTQRMLGVLPVLLHPDPKDVCVIGLGSGVTLSSAVRGARLRRADVVEISPEVVAASRLFVRENGNVLADPGVRLIVGDGRTHLELSSGQYDVIISEPSNPWMAGIAALFTREFFAAAKARLKPGGVFCQWAHTYEMSAGDLQSIVRTFASVLPQATMWLVGDGDLLLVGTTDPDIGEHLAHFVERTRDPSVQAVLADLAITPATAPFQLLSMYAGGPAEAALYGNGASVQNDDRMSLEFTAPRQIYGGAANGNSAAIRTLVSVDRLPAIVAKVMQSADAQSWKARGSMELRAQAYSRAYESYRQAIALDKSDPDLLKGLSDAAAGSNRQMEERAWLEAAVRASPANAVLQVELSHVRAAAGDGEGAIAAASEAQRLEPDDPRPAEQLASVLADMGDAARLQPLADALVARYPDRDDGRYYRATAFLLRGQIAEAADEARRLLTANPSHAKAQNLLGVACASAGQRECAEAAFQASIRLNPRESSAYVNLGLIRLEAAAPATAEEYFAEALVLEPTSAKAKVGLAQARAALSGQ
jgi:spermidine synthase